jgi:hypothetical protein
VQVGGAVGLAILATLSTDRTDSLLGEGESLANALNSGYHLAYLVGTALIGVAIVIALRAFRSEEPAEAAAAAPLATEQAYPEAA